MGTLTKPHPMSPDSPSPSERSPTSRRQLLATLGVVSAVSIAGCNAIGSVAEPKGEGDMIEVLVENRTDEIAQIAVYIADDDGNALFSRVYELEPHHLDSSASLEARPATVTVFTPDGTSTTWEYSPESEFDLNCDGVDIGVTLKPEWTIESWYAC